MDISNIIVAITGIGIIIGTVIAVIKYFSDIIEAWKQLQAIFNFVKYGLSRLTEEGNLTFWMKKLGSEKENERLEAIEKLSRMKSKSLMPRLKEALIDNSNENKCKAAAQCLGRIGKPSLLTLINVYEDSSNQIYEKFIGIAFKEMKSNNEAIESILSLLNPKEGWPRRRGAAFALGEIQSSDNIQFLITKTREEGHWEVRVELITALGKIRDDKAILCLIDILENDNNWKVKATAAKALGNMGDPAPLVIDSLIKALDNVNSELCEEVASVLGELGKGDPKAADALIGKLNHDHPAVVREVATALCKICDPKGVNEIGNIALNHADLEIRKICVEALSEKENNLDKVKHILEAVILNDPLSEVGKLASQIVREIEDKLKRRGSYGVVASHS